MIPSMILSALPLLTGCAGTPAVPVEAAVDPRWEMPGPLPRRALNLTDPVRATLSNGVEVVLVEDHELPTVSLRVVFDVGRFADPEGMEGLATATMDMLNEGAGDYDGLALSDALRALASSVGSSGGWDSSTVSAGSLTRNLEPTLDIMADVLLRPTFPASEWERIHKQYLQDLASGRANPNSVAGRVSRRVMFGETYRGRHTNEDAWGAVTVDAMQGWYEDHIVPGNAMIFASGDVTMDALTALLEARLGDWTAEGEDPAPTITIRQPEATTIYLHDRPGSAQSVISAGRFGGGPTDADYTELLVGNMAFGGMFAARLNLNLREDKGYTYGARSGLSSATLAPIVWSAGASVRTDVTAESLTEILKELDESIGDRPLSEEEVAYMKSSMLNSYPSRFETAGYQLSGAENIWRLGLPEDWQESYIPRVEAVTAEGANTAFAKTAAGHPLAVVIVGDAAVVREPLAALGLPIVDVDVDGNPISPTENAEE